MIAELRATTRRDRATIDSLTRVARATDAPHEASVAGTRAAELEAERRIRASRAAIARDSIETEATRREIALATSTEILLARLRLERAAAARRIEAYAVTVTYVERAAPAIDSLTNAQAERIRTLERGRPWWRRALAASCSGLTVGTGAGGGAVIGGPVGAAVGGLVGYAGGAVACR